MNRNADPHPADIAPAARGSRLRAWSVAALLVAGSSLVGLLLVEGAFRLFGRYAPQSLHLLSPDRELPDVQTEWDLVYRTNDLGLRGPLPRRPRPESVALRVAVIGDSFAFGQGVAREDSFPALLERLLAEPGKPAEVVNVSNIGIGAEAYWVLLRDVALRFEPDTVVVNVFGNDASTAVKPSWPRRLLARLSQRSHLATLARTFNRERARRRNRQVTGDPELYWSRLVEDCAAHRGRPFCEEAVAAFRRRHGSRINNLAALCLREPDELRRWVDADAALPGWRTFERYIVAMAELCRERRIRFVVGIVPDAVQVEPAQLDLRRGLGVPYADSVLVEPGGFQTLVHDLCRRLGVECFDPLEAFRAEPEGLYYPTDLHWTASGHRRYAELLHRFLAGDA